MASGTAKIPNDESPNGRNGRRYSPIRKCQSGCNDKNRCCPHRCGKARCTINYISETSGNFAPGRFTYSRTDPANPASRITVRRGGLFGILVKRVATARSRALRRRPKERLGPIRDPSLYLYLRRLEYRRGASKESKTRLAEHPFY
jgi:hypothetical protein